MDHLSLPGFYRVQLGGIEGYHTSTVLPHRAGYLLPTHVLDQLPFRVLLPELTAFELAEGNAIVLPDVVGILVGPDLSIQRDN